MDNVFLQGPLFLGGLILVFAFSNGFRDSSTIVATVVSTKTMTPRKAFFFCAVAEFLGVIFFGSAVVMTISRDLFGPILAGPKADLQIVLLSATGAALVWGLIGWWAAWPISNKHTIFGGLVGASLGMWGFKFFQNFTFTIIILVLILSPLIGFLVSIAVTQTLHTAGEWLTPLARGFLEKFHMAACMMLAFAHGTNDGQIVISLLVLGFGLAQAAVKGGMDPVVEIPFQFRLAVAVALSLGVLTGGYRILKKMGMSFYRIRLVQGVSATISSVGTVLGCSALGLPASTTQVITGSIIGAGVAKSPASVRWEIAQEIILAWVVTLPMAAAIALFFSKILKEGWI